MAEPKMSTTQINLPPRLAKAVLSLQSEIAPEDLVAIEDVPHVTVRYGVQGDDPAPIAGAVRGYGEASIVIDGGMVFSNPDEDVLVLRVNSQDLFGLRRRVESVACEPAKWAYTPHVTIAYLKPGSGKKYDNLATGFSTSFVASEMVFSDSNRKQTVIPLGNATEDDANTSQGDAMSTKDEVTKAIDEETQRLLDKGHGRREYDCGHYTQCRCATHPGQAPLPITKIAGNCPSCEAPAKEQDRRERPLPAEPFMPSSKADAFVTASDVPLMKSEEHPDYTYVFGPVLIPGQVDRQGDYCTRETVEKSAHEFMLNSQQVGLMHSVNLGSRDSVIVESYTLPTDLVHKGRTIPAGTWMMGTRIYNPKLRDLVRKGQLRGYSIGGRGKRIPVKS